MVEFILWTVGIIFVIWLSAYIFFNYFYTLKGGQGGLEEEVDTFLEEEKRSYLNTQNRSTEKNTPKRNDNEDTDDGDFLTSALVGAATNSTLIGTAVGGSLVGAMIGDMLVDDEHEIDEPEEDTDWGDDD